MPTRPSSQPPPHRGQADPLVGRELGGKFTLEALIARGAMGKVYRAKQASLGRTCAVKVLNAPEGEGADGEFHQRFLREASIGARLTHPNTVTIFDYGVEGDLYYIAMELLEGRTLARVLREEGPLSEERAAQIARQICRSLREAHALGVVHRDLKPANVYLVQRADEGDVVKVLDFGLVKRVEADPGDDLTQAGVFVGSPKYMAPEQIRGEHVDARVDIYALGTMLFEMLSGHVPFDRPKPVDTLLAQVNAKVPPLREKMKGRDLDPRLEAIVMKCLGKNPEDRFASMEELLTALKLSGGGQLTATQGFEIASSVGAYGTSSSHPPARVSDIPRSAPPSQSSAATSASRAQGRWVAIAAGAAVLATLGVVFVLSHGEHSPHAALTTGGAHASASSPLAPSTAPFATSATAAKATASSSAKPPDEVPVSIDSDPSGAKIRDEQRSILCDATPCKLHVGNDGLVVIVDAKGYPDEKVKLMPGDGPRVVKLTKQAVWRPAATAAPTHPAAPPPKNVPPTISTGVY